MSDILYGSTILVGLGVLIVVDSKSHPGTPRSVGLLWLSDRSIAETTHNTHKRQTSMLPAGFETAILGSEQSKADSLVKLLLQYISLSVLNNGQKIVQFLF
jgi:hypothetical protein